MVDTESCFWFWWACYMRLTKVALFSIWWSIFSINFGCLRFVHAVPQCRHSIHAVCSQIFRVNLPIIHGFCEFIKECVSLHRCLASKREEWIRMRVLMYFYCWDYCWVWLEWCDWMRKRTVCWRWVIGYDKRSSFFIVDFHYRLILPLGLGFPKGYCFILNIILALSVILTKTIL